MELILNYVIPTVVTLLLVAAYAVGFYFLTKNKSERAKMLPIIILWALMVAAEIWKISHLIAKDGAFNPNRYPIVFCSLVMYTIPVFAFKENRFSNIAKVFTLFTSIFAVLAFFATQWQYPFSGMNIHSYFYHGSMLAISVYMIVIKTYKFEFNDHYKLFLVIAGYIAFNTLLGLWVNDYISLFGPHSSYLGFLDGIFGFLPKNLLLLPIAYLLCLGVFALINLGSKNKKEAK